jgi:hypothetical protein
MRRKKDPIQNLIIVALSIILLIIVIPMFIPIGEPAQVLFKQTQEEELVVETQDTYIEFVETPFLDEVAQEVVMPTYEINVPLEWQEFGWDICQQHSFPYETWLAVMRQESGFNLKAVGINYAKDNKTILSKDLGLMGLNDRFKETHASAAGIPIDEFDYFNPYHNIKAGIIELVNHRDYWYAQGINGDENVWIYMLNSYNMGRGGYSNYIASRGSISRIYDQKILKWKTMLEMEGRLP